MNEQNFASKFEVEFADFLKIHGYPDGSLMREPIIKDINFRPDFLVIDITNNEHLAIIEIKKEISDKNVHAIKKQMDFYKQALGDSNIAVFIAIQSGESFDLFTFRKDNTLEKLNLHLFPNFKTLSANNIVERKLELKKGKEKTADSFDDLCRNLSYVLISIVVADFILSLFKIPLLSVERMSLIGAIIVFFIIPYAQKFKAFGIEWEGMQTRKK
jgi:hypothetical protein